MSVNTSSAAPLQAAPMLLPSGCRNANPRVSMRSSCRRASRWPSTSTGSSPSTTRPPEGNSTMNPRILHLVILAWISLAAGCAGSKDTVLPQDGPSMQSIYDAHFERIGAAEVGSLREATLSRPLSDGVTDLAGFSRDAFNE